jgi:hypothetical protein
LGAGGDGGGYACSEGAVIVAADFYGLEVAVVSWMVRRVWGTGKVYAEVFD